ncbi:hypothetical protein [Virgibacillus sp. 6R]|uniref:hypothetical protein n=1 Tax=Metabacillus sp. 22489 TaxID=3453928 RepID=UPI0011A99C06
MKKIIVVYILLPIISIILVSLTPFLIPSNVESYEEFQDANFGFPIPFVKQNLLESGSGYVGGFPQEFGLQMDFLDNDPQFKFHFISYFFSVCIIYFFLLLIYFFLRKVIKYLRFSD